MKPTFSLSDEHRRVELPHLVLGQLGSREGALSVVLGLLWPVQLQVASPDLVTQPRRLYRRLRHGQLGVPAVHPRQLHNECKHGAERPQKP